MGESNVLIGVQFGDEGKGKIVDLLISNCDILARFNGANNAGHTLEVGGIKLALHQIPSGIFHKDMQLYIGSGCLVSPIALVGEIKNISEMGINLKGRLKISSQSTLIQPHHILLDGQYGKSIGTTGNGIGPAYADQALRTAGDTLKNIRVGDYLANPESMQKFIRQSLKDVGANNIDRRLGEFDQAMQSIARYVSKDPLYLHKEIAKGKKVFFEGANSTMLDVITGTVPFVTSSRTLASAAYTGGDLSSKYHNKTYAVAKAIMSRVGNGPFISEFGGRRNEEYCAKDGGYAYTEEKELALYDPKILIASDDMLEIGIALRMLGGEYGATTKRPRRMGMLDLVMLKQNCMVNGVDELYITKFDCLRDFAKTTLPGIPIVIGYKLDGEEIDYIPTTVEESYRTAPIIKYLPHITDNLTAMRTPKELPSTAKLTIGFIKDYLGVKIGGIGVGPNRNQIIKL